jgi:acetyltransferase-like isoleucine patch superfamily enzyme
MKSSYKAFMYANLPLPRAFKPIGNALYEFRSIVLMFCNRLVAVLYREPLFRSRCEQAGKRLSIGLMPAVYGHTRIYLGDDVRFHGQLVITSGRTMDNPTLVLGDRVSVGHMVTISCNNKVTIEDDVYVAANVTISDNDGHPVDPDLRTSGMPAPAETTRPVRICRQAWIGGSCHILKGVTIGRAAIVGAGSIVTSDIPPFSIAAGNPARVIRTIRPAEEATSA